jgi:hypothetical protein
MRYAMVYRCRYDYWGETCSWSTENYAEIDEHENQIEPGHYVMGQMEGVEDE